MDAHVEGERVDAHVAKLACSAIRNACARRPVVLFRFYNRSLLTRSHASAMHEYRLEINMDHLQTFNSTLHDELRDNPSTLMPLFERAAKKVYEAMVVGDREFKELNDIQVILTLSCIN
jgi:hypothetical protein